MLKKYVLGVLKFLFVDSIVNILGDLFEQPLAIRSVYDRAPD